MGAIVDEKQLIELLANHEKRIQRLEKGGISLVKWPGLEGPTEVTLANGAETVITVTTSWKDSSIQVNPFADLYYELYLNNDNNTLYSWPGGASITDTQRKELYVQVRKAGSLISQNPNKSYHQLTIHNATGSPVTLYFYFGTPYVSGQTGSTA